MIQKLSLLLILCAVFSECQSPQVEDFNSLTADSPSIAGKDAYLGSPYVTAGDRVYMVGHQDGTFPDLGWHIQGEMGGIWNHPIKLMDGFKVNLQWEEEDTDLGLAYSFVNYPYANKHLYQLEDKNLSIERWQFVPDHLEGLAVQFIIKNTGNTPQNFEFTFGHCSFTFVHSPTV